MGDENIDELLRRRDQLLEDRETDELLRRRDLLLESRETKPENFFMQVVGDANFGFGVSQFSDNYSKNHENWESRPASGGAIRLGGLIQLIRNAQYMVFVKQTDSWTPKLKAAIGALDPFYMWILTNRGLQTNLFLNLFDVKIINIIPRLGAGSNYAGFDVVEIKFSDSTVL
jgi:hypothetical protein